MTSASPRLDTAATGSNRFLFLALAAITATIFVVGVLLLPTPRPYTSPEDLITRASASPAAIARIDRFERNQVEPYSCGSEPAGTPIAKLHHLFPIISLRCRLTGVDGGGAFANYKCITKVDDRVDHRLLTFADEPGCQAARSGPSECEGNAGESGFELRSVPDRQAAAVTRATTTPVPASTNSATTARSNPISRSSASALAQANILHVGLRLAGYTVTPVRSTGMSGVQGVPGTGTAPSEGFQATAKDFPVEVFVFASRRGADATAAEDRKGAAAGRGAYRQVGTDIFLAIGSGSGPQAAVAAASATAEGTER